MAKLQYIALAIILLYLFPEYVTMKQIIILDLWFSSHVSFY